MKRIWDISPPVAAGSPVFPGDTPYQQHWAATHRAGLPGQREQHHAVAARRRPCRRAAALRPRRAHRSATLDLEPYLGPCRVIHAIGCGPLVAMGAPRSTPRATCRRACWCAPTNACPSTAGTASSPPTRPRPSSGSPTLGVKLVGIDTASIDPAESKTLDSHQVIRRLRPARAGEPGARRRARGRLRTDRPAPETDDRRRLAGARGAARTP